MGYKKISLKSLLEMFPSLFGGKKGKKGFVWVDEIVCVYNLN